MRKIHKNIPIFIPHMGCPNMCVFCNQRSISGQKSFDRESVREKIWDALKTIPHGAEVEIAYFGGSFTGIERELMIYLLDVAESFVSRKDDGYARVCGIRMSTRPDYINEEILDILSNYTVSAIELGLQSMDSEVLSSCRRGHTSHDAETACRKIKERGYLRSGYWADVVLVRPNASWVVTPDTILSKCGWSPMEGHTYQWKVEQTFVNGQCVYTNGKVMDEVRGQSLEFDR